jgi:hypothetical protein
MARPSSSLRVSAAPQATLVLAGTGIIAGHLLHVGELRHTSGNETIRQSQEQDAPTPAPVPPSRRCHRRFLAPLGYCIRAVTAICPKQVLSCSSAAMNAGGSDGRRLARKLGRTRARRQALHDDSRLLRCSSPLSFRSGQFPLPSSSGHPNLSVNGHTLAYIYVQVQPNSARRPPNSNHSSASPVEFLLPHIEPTLRSIQSVARAGLSNRLRRCSFQSESMLRDMHIVDSFGHPFQFKINERCFHGVKLLVRLETAVRRCKY